MLKRYLFALILLLVSTSLYATIDLTTVTGWSTVLQGADLDHGNDQQATASIDLLGNATYPMFYMEFDDLGDADITNDEVAFSFRGDKAVDNQGDFIGYLWIGLDFDNDGKIDAFMVLNGDGTPTGQALTVYDSDGSKANNSPSSTSLITTPTPVTGGFSFKHYLAPDIADVDDDGVIFGAAFGDGDPDYIVSYKVNLQALAVALNLQTLSSGGTVNPVALQTLDGGNGVGLNTPFKIVVSSAESVNALNGDLGGFDKTDDPTTTYVSQGAFTPTISFSDTDPLDLAQTTITATPASVVADGSTTSTITLQAKDSVGTNLTTSAGTLLLSEDGSATISAVIDNGDGTYTATITNMVAENIAISGTIEGNAITDTANVAFTPGAASATDTTIFVSAASVIADGSSTSTITVQAIDINGNNLVAGGDSIVLSSTGSAVVSSVTDNANGTYTATITSMVAEAITISGTIGGVAITDTAAVTFDVTKPVITLNSISPLTIERAGGYLDPGATATDNVDTAAAITAAIVAVNTVDPDVAGAYTVTYDVSDAAGNAAVQVVRTVEVVDTTPPGVSILNQPGSVNNLNRFNVTFKFTEIVNGFVDTDISILNAVVSNFINVGGVGDTYTADIKPNSSGDVSIGVNANVAQDLSANGNTAAITQVTVFDNTPPDVAVTSFPAVNLANQSAYTVSGTCSVGDGNVLVLLSLGPAFFTPFEKCTAGGRWSFTFDLSSLSDTAAGFMISIGARQTDAGGNVGNAVAVEVDKDTVRPGVQIQNVPAFVNADEFIVSFVFDEDVSGFDSGDIVVTNGAINLASFNAVDAKTYTVGIAATADITINVAANIAQDLVGNGNDAATPASAVFDITAPVVDITVPAVVNAANDSSYMVAGTCDNGDGDVTVNIAGATLNPAIQDMTCTAGNWSRVFDVSTIADGTNVITIDASQTDAAGNKGNAATVQVNKDVLIAIPTVDLLTTNNVTPVIGGAAEADSFLTIVVAGATYTVTTDAGGLWTFDTATVAPDSGIFILLDGQNDVAVTSVDAAGNSATDVTVNEITLTLDDDIDGIPNAVECPSGPPYDNSCTDTDGDGTPDFQEVDSDNDGIPDAVEAGLDANNPIDSDGDGKPDYQDTDSDNDGIADVVEGAIDTDGDGIPDYVDIGSTGDSDGDGIPDSVECAVYPACADTNGDGQPDYLDIDSDGDGINDAVEAGVDPVTPIDTDGDGTPDYRDTDSDDDGTDDNVEGMTDNDGDGIPDYVDAASAGPAPNAGDSDGDGIADNIECELYPLCADSDNDGTPDYMEVDSDNDGIPDAVEAGTAINDADNDGIDDAIDVDLTGGLDLNNDDIDDTQPLDTDGDGTPDYQDTDSDGDGIDDVIEGVVDTDADGIPDYLDADNGDASGTDITGSGDSDGDGISDADECLAGIPCTDVDADGTPDYMDPNPDDGPLADFDNDGRLNYLDPDDDNDRIPDVVEDPNFDADNDPSSNALDSDFDGIPDYLDLDSDADGLTDADESGASGNDADGDNIDDSYDIDITGGADSNADGIDDNITPRDSDGDSLPDYIDTYSAGDGSQDTDKDGIPDNVECPVYPVNCPDTDGDGTPDFLEIDSDGDGLADSDEKGSLASGVLLDTDGDGLPDYRDLDSDGDGIPDASESLTTDGDNDGIPDALDADSSGAPFGGDSDGDGVPDMDECNSYPDCADSNNDGAPDYMDANAKPYDPNAKINTGLNGAGSSGPWSLFILTLVLLFRRKITLVADK